ncbi:MAG TPA: DUF6798 domain-containing protein [Terracidiphilus sp.]|nr:DUF6798 domain-containing protein [Terracidiphilus sp.]
MSLERPGNQNLFARISITLFFTLVSFAVMGYHPGLEDDGIYLAAVKARLNPALYARNSEFFKLQLQATAFDSAMAWFVRITHIPVPWAELLWQLAAIFAILWATHLIARRLFREAAAQWAAVAMVGAMLTLPVAGTALFLVDQHLHPRTIATALILLAVAQVMEGRGKAAVGLLALAGLMHPLMAALGISFCVFLAAVLKARVYGWVEGLWPGERAISGRNKAVKVGAGAGGGFAAAAAPLAWVFEGGNPGWREALNAHSYYFIYKWAWYEWLGAVAPLALFCVLWRWAGRRGERDLARFGLAVFAYGVFQQVVALVVLPPLGWLRVTPLQPMRYLHLVYFAMALVGGGLLGRFVLKKSVWRWAVCLAVMNTGMLACQETQFPASRHLELPGLAPCNDWIAAFDWIRQNTPEDAYFALDPHYLDAPGEDYHGFRALAERSSLADAVKDAAVVTQIPSLGEEWLRQVEAQQDWDRFQIGDFERLKREFGVDWVVVSRSSQAGLDCRWRDRTVAVCRVP